MKTVYFNVKNGNSVETIDEFTRGQDSPASPKEFRKYIFEMLKECRMSGNPAYMSSRCTKEWKTR